MNKRLTFHLIGNVVGTVADTVVAATTVADLWRTREKK